MCQSKHICNLYILFVAFRAHIQVHVAISIINIFSSFLTFRMHDVNMYFYLSVYQFKFQLIYQL